MRPLVISFESFQTQDSEDGLRSGFQRSLRFYIKKKTSGYLFLCSLPLCEPLSFVLLLTALVQVPVFSVS